MTDSGAFFQLDERIRRFIWAEGWTELRDAQEKAIPLIVDGERDVIVAAATAAGKTEAAFFPALTHLLRSDPPTGLIVYVSPLKALINDQFGRLDKLCAQLGVSVWPWHGDISAGVKQRFQKNPTGVLLITPESLEATLCNRGSGVASLFASAAYFVVDELHAFIGSERGKQLQSLMHRIELAVGRKIPRIGLSATLGTMNLACEFLRPGQGAGVAVVESEASETSLKIAVRGYEEPAVSARESNNDEADERGPETPAHVAVHLFKTLRGSNNLVFPNSRREVERYTHLLTEMCAKEHVPNEFWPHHGSLSKEIRSETEAALKRTDRPASAICTNTLELGIDIGAVKSVAQIGPPPAVASLRQRLGRSGRRKGESAVLRGYCIEDAITGQSDLSVRLRLGTVQLTAMISLLLERWFEPPATHGIHWSTLIQQLLSLIAQKGGIGAGQAFKQLADVGAPFEGISTDEFKELLRHLAKEDLLVQESSGLLLHGLVGERLVNHYSFYASFASDEEFRIVAGGQSLGTLPVSQMLTVGQHILFAGRTWRVDEVNEKDKAIFVMGAKGGAPPLFSGGTGRVHSRVRQRMRQLLAEHVQIDYLDSTAARFLDQARREYDLLELNHRVGIDVGQQVVLFTWLGDSANQAIACFLNQRGLTAWPSGPSVEISKGTWSLQEIEHILTEAARNQAPSMDVLLKDAKNLECEKWDWALPPPLLRKAYGSLHLDVDEALEWIRRTYDKQIPLD